MTKTQESMQRMGKFIVAQLPEDWGFILGVFPANPEGETKTMNYVSNCPREQVIAVMEEFIRKTKEGWGRDKNEGMFGVGKK